MNKSSCRAAVTLAEGATRRRTPPVRSANQMHWSSGSDTSSDDFPYRSMALIKHAKALYSVLRNAFIVRVGVEGALVIVAGRSIPSIVAGAQVDKNLGSNDEHGIIASLSSL